MNTMFLVAVKARGANENALPNIGILGLKGIRYPRSPSRKRCPLDIGPLTWGFRVVGKPLNGPPGEYGRKAEIEEVRTLNMEWDLAYLVGALRDGSVYYDKSRNYKIIWYENNKEWLQKSIAERVFRVFGKYPRIDEYKKGHYRAVLSSMDAFHMIKKDYGFIAPQVKWDTPIKITKSSDAIVSTYTAGYFDAEGDVNPKKYMIGICQKNKDSLDFIRRWLNIKGIKTSKTFIADKRSGTHRFYMTSRKNISNFQDLVKFEHPDKIMRLELLLQHT